MSRQCEFSSDRIYRYTLWREWDVDSLTGCADDLPRVHEYLAVIGLNPSTADETQDDPTIKKCVKFAKRWGFGALCMTNLFAYRSTFPRDLLKVDDPTGPENLQHLFMAARDAGMVLAAWGKSVPIISSRAEFVSGVLKAGGVNLFALRKNSDGSPQHPIYVPDATEPMPFP